MSTRAAVILIAVFALAALVFGWWLMGGSGLEFAAVGLIIAVAVGTIAIVVPVVFHPKPARPPAPAERPGPAHDKNK